MKEGPVLLASLGFRVRVSLGSWGLSNWVTNGDNWDYCMAYKGYKYTY